MSHLLPGSGVATWGACTSTPGAVDVPVAPLRVSGTGVQVTHADDIVIRGSTITGNVPSADPFSLGDPAGGLALITPPPFDDPLGIDPVRSST